MTVRDNYVIVPFSNFIKGRDIMRIAGAHEYWRSLCWSIRKRIEEDHELISEEEWGKRDISNHKLVMTYDTILHYSMGYAHGYSETDWFHEVKPIILDTCCFDDLEFHKLRRVLDVSDEDKAAWFMVATMVRFVLLNHYQPKRKNKRLVIGA